MKLVYQMWADSSTTLQVNEVKNLENGDQQTTDALNGMEIELLITDRTAVKDPCYYELTDHDHDT